MKNLIRELLKEIKVEYILKFGQDDLYDEGIYGSCVVRWVHCLNNEKYIDIFSNLTVKQSGCYVMFKYDKFCKVFATNKFSEFWDMYDGIYRYCRGVVFDITSKDIDIVALPFDKFFNIGEVSDSSMSHVKELIDKSEYVEISEKMDGSLCFASKYNGVINLFGSNSLEAKNSKSLKIAKMLFDKDLNYSRMINENEGKTFIFELISQYDKHVVDYPSDMDGLYLCGIRCNDDGKLYPYSKVSAVAESYNVKHVKFYYGMSLDDALSSLSKYKANEKEGYVLNIDGNLFKLKCDDYVNIHKLLSKASSYNVIIKSIVDDTFDDIISKVPIIHRERTMRIYEKIVKWRNDRIDYIKTESDKLKKLDLADRELYPYIIKNYPKGYSSMIIRYLKNGNIEPLKNGNGRYLKAHEIFGRDYECE